MQKILIVEDDIELNKGLCKALRNETTVTASALCLEEARAELELGGIRLVILDENLPDGSGLDLLEEIRKRHSDMAIILLTANDTDQDIVEGLEKGADDYITKPFSLSVLRARVNTQLRKTVEKSETQAVYRSSAYCFDFDKMIFTVNGSQIELSKTEQKLLKILVENRGITLERGRLVDRVWTDGAEYVDENALSVTVKRLRDKLGAGEKIKTVYGIGYTWIKADE